MAYQFNRKVVSTFRFNTNAGSTEKTSLQGINASLSSADTICDGVSSLMAIGGNTPYYIGAERTVKDSVDEDS